MDRTWADGAVLDGGGAWRDLAVVFMVSAGVFALAGLLELSEVIEHGLRHFENYQLDELPVAMIVLVAGLSWSSWRRSRQASAEMGLRMRAQKELDHQRQQLQVLFNENLSANLVTDAAGRIALANPEFGRLLGLASGAEAVGLSLRDFYPETAAWDLHRTELAARGRLDVPELRLRRGDGTEAMAIARFTARPVPGGGLEIHAFFTDVTTLGYTRRDLATALAENRRLAQRGIEALEEERRHLARELHDEMGQWLNALKIDAVGIRDRDGLPGEVREAAQGIVELTDHVYDVARALVRRLRPVALDELGLDSALQHCVDQWRRRHPAVRCELSLAGLPADLGETTNITLYRLVQEGLTNVARHARARHVHVALRASDDGARVLAEVEDDGVGIASPASGAGVGLAGLRERVEMLGGRLRVEPASPAGTRLLAMLPRVPREVPAGEDRGEGVSMPRRVAAGGVS